MAITRSRPRGIVDAFFESSKYDEIVHNLECSVRLPYFCLQNSKPTLRSLMDYQPVVVKSKARPSSSKHSAESRYWRQFRHPVFIKEYAPITSVHFSPSKPHRYAVTAATRVQIYAPRTQKITKTISRFKDVARSGSIRGDGKLVVAGDDSGLVQVSQDLCF